VSDKVPATPGGGKTTFSGPSFWYVSGTEDRVRVHAGALPGVFWGVAMSGRERREFVRDPNSPEGWVPVKE
jgi:hypothetical protein